MVLEVFEPSSGARWGELEGGFFVVGFAVDDGTPDDSREFVGSGDDAFGFAEAAFEAADVALMVRPRAFSRAAMCAEEAVEMNGYFSLRGLLFDAWLLLSRTFHGVRRL